ncbi:MAG: hypothetical protein GY696_08075 [Gammaproteobacteria bacterium]|nr:hypothetical protein [Gammaproteobacteria bacterium]
MIYCTTEQAPSRPKPGGGHGGPVGLGAPPQTPGRLRRKIVAGGSDARTPLGLRPRPRRLRRKSEAGGSACNPLGAPPQSRWGLRP